MIRSGIYTITNGITGDCYVGSAVNFTDRKSLHLRKLRQGAHHSKYLQNAYLKYGEDVFTFNLIEELPRDKKLLFEREDFWICQLKPVYNVGQLAHTHLGVKRSEETKLKQAQAALARRKPTEEECQKLSEAAKNRKYTDEGRRKRSEMMKARWAKTELTDEDHVRMSESSRKGWQGRTEEDRKAFREKAAQTRLGVRRSLESRLKQGVTNTGRKHTPESIQRMSEAKKLQWQKRKQALSEQSNQDTFDW